MHLDLCAMLIAASLGAAAPQGPAPPAPSAVETTAITAQLLAPDGKPIAGAGVAFGRPGEVTTDDALSRPLAISNRSGELAFELPRADLESGVLLVAAPGRSAIELHFLREQVPVRLDLGPLFLFPGVELSGRVRDASGKPIAGVRVDASDNHELFRQQQHHCWTQRVSSGVTGSDGIYRLHGAAPGIVQLTLRKWGYRGLVEFPVRTDTPLSPTLEPCGFATGRLLGAPPGATLRILCETPDPAPGEPQLAADGSFRVSAPAHGRYRIFVFTGNGIELLRSELLRGPAAGIELRIQTAADHVLQLHVTSGDQPVAAFTVAAHWLREPPPQHWFREVLNRMPRAVGSDAASDGLARITVPGWARLGLLWVGAAGHATRQLDIADASASTLACALQPEAVVTGCAVDAITGKPLAGVRAFAVSPKRVTMFSMPPTVATTGVDGRFRIDGMPSGDFLVQLDHVDCDVPHYNKLSLLAGQTADLGKIALQPIASRIRGRIRGDRPPPGSHVGSLPGESISIALDAEPRYWPSRWPAPVVVDPSGGFALHPTPEHMDLALFLPPANAASPPLAVPLGTVHPGAEVQDFAVDLATASISGVLHLGGPPSAAASLRVVALARGQVVAVSDLDPAGRYSLRLLPGRYQLQVIDLVTGLELMSTTELVEPVRGGEQRRDLGVQLCSVTIELQPEHRGGEIAVATLLFDRSPPSTNYLRYGGDRQLRIAAGSPSLVVYLPPGDLTVQVQSCADCLNPSGGNYRNTTLGQREITVVAGKAQRIAMPVTAPPADAALR